MASKTLLDLIPYAFIAARILVPSSMSMLRWDFVVVVGEFWLRVVAMLEM